jgi:anti-sigma regulatory factor (Ser/Thr protein kinase)
LSLVGAVLRTEPHPGLEVRLDVEVDPVRCAREQLGAWLAGLGASPMDQMGVTHAAAELVTNAFEHGARGHDPWVELRARLGSNGVALVEVLDHGTWQAPVEDATRGRGLAMAAGLVDHLGVALRPDGTRAFLQHRLLHAAPIEVVRATARVDSDPAPVEVVHTAPHALALKGAFGHDDVDGVAAQLLVATRGGTVRLSLDLREVTSLSTSAVQLLTDLTSVNRAVGMYAADIEILSTADSTVQRILDSACIPHHGA